jgi:hypothetical protein
MAVKSAEAEALGNSTAEVAACTSWALTGDILDKLCRESEEVLWGPNDRINESAECNAAGTLMD